jgi:copper chaperone
MENVNMITLKITGMTCGHCAKAVTDALAKVAGVDDVVEVSLERNEALIEGRPDLEALVAAVREEGYGAQAS